MLWYLPLSNFTDQQHSAIAAQIAALGGTSAAAAEPAHATTRVEGRP